MQSNICNLTQQILRFAQNDKVGLGFRVAACGARNSFAGLRAGRLRPARLEEPNDVDDEIVCPDPRAFETTIVILNGAKNL